MVKAVKIFRKFFVLFLSFSIVAAAVFIYQNNQAKTAYAVGAINVEWGVPDGDPIFVVTNMLPGDVEEREVEVINNDTVSRNIVIQGVKTAETLNFSTILDFVILEGVTPIYGTGSGTGPKTLSDFFSESDLDGIPLSSVAASGSTTYKFIATFPSSAGNEWQTASVIFDLIISMEAGGDIPAECSHIEFDGDPIFGTAIGDNLQGTEGNDLIYGLEGGDSINGKGGDDCLVGNEVGDSVFGGPGNDVLLGLEDGDSLKGEDGEDLLIGAGGGDTLKGGNDNDELYGNEGHDSLDGEGGDDFLDAADGDDSLFGGEGNDEMHAGPGKDSVKGGGGNDKILGEEDGDIIKGEDGNDDIDGGPGEDNMSGGNGDDKVIGGPDFDKANGDSDTDTCDAEIETTCELDP